MPLRVGLLLVEVQLVVACKLWLALALGVALLFSPCAVWFFCHRLKVRRSLLFSLCAVRFRHRLKISSFIKVRLRLGVALRSAPSPRAIGFCRRLKVRRALVLAPGVALRAFC